MKLLIPEFQSFRHKYRAEPMPMDCRDAGTACKRDTMIFTWYPNNQMQNDQFKTKHDYLYEYWKYRYANR